MVYDSTSPGRGRLVFSRKAVVTRRHGCLVLVLRVADPVEVRRGGVVIRQSDMDYGGEVTALVVDHAAGPTAIRHIQVPIRLNRAAMPPFPAGLPHGWLQQLGAAHVAGLPLSQHGRVQVHPFSPPLPSPLHYLTPDTIATSKLEVIVTATGSRQSGGAIYARTSYTMAEVVWGARFVHTVVLASEPSGGFTASCEQEDVDRSHPLPSSLTSSTHGG